MTNHISDEELKRVIIIYDAVNPKPLFADSVRPALREIQETRAAIDEALTKLRRYLDLREKSLGRKIGSKNQVRQAIAELERVRQGHQP